MRNHAASFLFSWLSEQVIPSATSVEENMDSIHFYSQSVIDDIRDHYKLIGAILKFEPTAYAPCGYKQEEAFNKYHSENAQVHIDSR